MVADRCLSARVTTVADDVRGVYAAGGPGSGGGRAAGRRQAARGDSAHSAAGDGTMTHAWLITGPPGSGRSVAALCFAAALQCTSTSVAGLRECRACTTTMAGTHADVRRVIPEGLSIGVDEMRAIVQIASRRPSTGRRQIVRDRGRRPVDRRRRERSAEGRRGAAAVDGVPAVCAVGGSGGHRDHAAVPVPACRAGDPVDRGDRAGAGRQRRPGRRHGELGGGGQRRSCRAGAPAGHRPGGPAAPRAGAGAGARRRRHRRGPTPPPRSWWPPPKPRPWC